MAEYGVKSGRIPPKSEWLAAMERLWATFNGLLGRHRAGSHSKTPEFSAKDFAAYCESKIGSVRADTAGSPSGVSADRSSHGRAEGNLLRRAPLTHHVVCSKVVRVRLSSGLSDPGLRGRFAPFPNSPLQP